MSGIDQKEYLKRYLGIGKGSGEKKKKKKTKKIGNGLKIVDDDIDLRLDEEIQLDLTGDNEEAPQIVSIIDDRPPSLRVDEETRSKLWKPIGALSETDHTGKTIKSDGNTKLAKNSVIKQYSLIDETDFSPAKKYKELKNRGRHETASSNRQESSKLGRKSLIIFPKRVIGETLSSDQDFSPLRQNRRNENINPPRRNKKHNSDSDNSPPRKSTGDRDNSPMRKRRKSNDFSPLRRRSEKIDSSPPRLIKREESEDFSPPRRKQREQTDSLSPKQSKKQITDDIVLPRRQGTENTDDLSPLRNRQGKEIDSSPPRRMDREKSEDNSPPRNKKGQEADSSPPRRSRSGRNDDLSPPRKKRGTEADFSPPRRVKKEKTEESSPPRWKNIKKSRWGDSEEPNEKLHKTLDGKTAGLQNATELVRETEELKKREEELFKNLSSEISGVNAATVVRQKKNDVDFEEEERKKKAEEENKKKYDRWGKGLKQVDDMNEKLKNDLYEMSKPLARYADDEDLERHLKEQEREGDPMLAYIRQKKQKKAVEEGQPGIQQYEGDAPPNRFGIRPGYRWDGVDRSNGYEKRWFETQNSRKASIEESYKWSTEDM